MHAVTKIYILILVFTFIISTKTNNNLIFINLINLIKVLIILYCIYNSINTFLLIVCTGSKSFETGSLNINIVFFLQQLFYILFIFQLLFYIFIFFEPYFFLINLNLKLKYFAFKKSLYSCRVNYLYLLSTLGQNNATCRINFE